MINQKKLKEIMDYIEKAENPLVLFDDDPDGLCSYLLLKKIKDQAKGVVIKSSPVLDIPYLKKVEELTKEATYEVEINVNIDTFSDPALYIRAKDIEVDRANKKLMVKDTGFLTSVGRKYLGDPNTFAIKIENGAIFSTPLGGRITIKHPDGKIEVLEQY